MGLNKVTYAGLQRELEKVEETNAANSKKDDPNNTGI